MPWQRIFPSTGCATREVEADGTLTVRVMELGAPDASGRKRPVPTDKTETMHIDTLIPSIGETVDVAVLKKAGVKLNSKNWFEHDADYQLEDGVFISVTVAPVPQPLWRPLPKGAWLLMRFAAKTITVGNGKSATASSTT